MKKFIFALLIAVALTVGLLLEPVGVATVLTVGTVITAAVFFVANISRLDRRSGLIAGTNTAPADWGTHKGGLITMLAAAAITTRYKLVKKGADANHIAVIAAAADEPIGICTDEPAAAEDPVNVTMLGAHDGTVPMVAGGNITDGAVVYSKGDGTVIVKPTAAGTYWKVGTARGAWSSGETLEVIPCKPRKLIVIAALGNVNGAIAALTIGSVYSQAEVQALRGACETLADDLRAIAAALNSDADVALATT